MCVCVYIYCLHSLDWNPDEILQQIPWFQCSDLCPKFRHLPRCRHAVRPLQGLANEWCIKKKDHLWYLQWKSNSWLRIVDDFFSKVWKIVPDRRFPNQNMKNSYQNHRYFAQFDGHRKDSYAIPIKSIKSYEFVIQVIQVISVLSLLVFFAPSLWGWKVHRHSISHLLSFR